MKDIDILPMHWTVDGTQVLNLENRCVEYPLEPNDFMHILKNTGSTWSYVARMCGLDLYGYLIAWREVIGASTIEIKSLCVETEFRRTGVGSKLIRALITKAKKSRVLTLETRIRESNLDAQLFFRSMGFMCVDTLHRHFTDSQEDGYLMRRKL